MRHFLLATIILCIGFSAPLQAKPLPSKEGVRSLYKSMAAIFNQGPDKFYDSLIDFMQVHYDPEGSYRSRTYLDEETKPIPANQSRSQLIRGVDISRGIMNEQKATLKFVDISANEKEGYLTVKYNLWTKSKMTHKDHEQKESHLYEMSSASSCIEKVREKFDRLSFEIFDSECNTKIKQKKIGTVKYEE